MGHRSRRIVLSALLSLSALSAALFIPAATFAACDEGRWPASVQGQPTVFTAGARAGDYIWHDVNGWHLRVTQPGTAAVVFSGKIVSNAALTVAPVKLESGDGFTLSTDKKTLTYRFANHGRIDGLDFRTACASRLKIWGYRAGETLPTSRIWLGRAGRHPLQNPFVILRTS